MKNILFILSVILFVQFSFSQGFETTVAAPTFIPPCLDTTNSIGIQVLEFNNSYFVLSVIEPGNAPVCLNTSGEGYSITRFDLNGDTLYSKIFMHPDLAIDHTGAYHVVDLVIGPDSSIYVVGTDDYGVNQYDKLFIAKHNVSGALLWNNNYPTTEFNPASVILHSDTLFIAGKKFFNNNWPIGLMQFDTSGVLQWSGSSGPLTGFVKKIVKRSNDFVIVGNHVPIGMTYTQLEPFVVPFTGNWISPNFYSFGNPDHTYENIDAIINNDNNLMIAAYSTNYHQIDMIEIDNSNNTIDLFTYEPNNQIDYTRMRCFTQRPNNNYVFGLQRDFLALNNYGLSSSLLFEEFDSLGSIIRETEFAGHFGEGELMTDQNGQVIMVGSRINQDLLPEYYFYSTLLMRLDEVGLTDECQPQFHFQPYVGEFLDSLIEGGIVHLISNSYGETDNFYWKVDGIYYSDEVDTFLVATPGMHIIELVGCDKSYSDSIFVYPILGVDKLSKNHVIIYPNPAADNFTLRTELSGQLIVNNLEGKLIHSEAFSPGQAISTESWGKGVYIIQLLAENCSYMERLVKE